MSTNKFLPTIQELFKESWAIFIKNFLNLFLFSLMGIAAYFVLAIVAVIILAIFGVGIGALTSGLQTGNILQTSSIILITILLIIFLLAFAVIGAAWQIGQILILDHKENNISLINIIKKSLVFIIPLFITQFLASLIALGGFFVLIIPGILFSLFFNFTAFIVILEKRTGLDVLRRSMKLVTKNFWQIIARILIIWVLYIVSSIAFKDQSGLLFICNILLGWFSLAYYLTLYKQAKETVGENEKSKLLWVIVISLIGWIVLGGFTYFISQAISSGMFNNFPLPSKDFPSIVTPSPETTNFESFNKELIN